MPCPMSDRTTASPPLISGMFVSPGAASLRGPRSGPKQSPPRCMHRRTGIASRRPQLRTMCGSESIRLDPERPLERRKPRVEDLCRLAGRFQIEQRAVDEFGEAWLVLLQAEAGGARQIVALDEGKILRRLALRREAQQQELVGQKAVDAPLLPRRD